MLNKKGLSEKEFEIVNIIADGFRTNQRTLSDQVGISLGMTNLLLKRLVTKGYLRIRQLNRKKIEYLLTARGLAEKTRKSFNYTLKTIESLGIIQSQIQEILKREISPSTRHVVVDGEGHLAEFTEMVVRDFSGGRFRVNRLASGHPVAYSTGTLLIQTRPKNGTVVPDATATIDLLTLLSNQYSPRHHRNGAEGEMELKKKR